MSAAGCRRAPSPTPPAPSPKAFGAAIVDISGEKQAAGAGTLLDQPVVAQVNDEKGTAVAGALVVFSAGGDARADTRFDPPSGLTGSDGQISTTVRLGSQAGRISLSAATRDKNGRLLQVVFPEIALDYQQTLGRELSEKHCARCHNSESTAGRVSNHDNLSKPPHAFSDGAMLNKIVPANLIAVISRGGFALGKSPEMPPYSPTLAASDIEALAAYIRAVADPPYPPQGVPDAKP